MSNIDDEPANFFTITFPPVVYQRSGRSNVRYTLDPFHISDDSRIYYHDWTGSQISIPSDNYTNSININTTGESANPFLEEPNPFLEGIEEEYKKIDIDAISREVSAVDDICCICLDTLNKYICVELNECLHVYHKECFKKALEKNEQPCYRCCLCRICVLHGRN